MPATRLFGDAPGGLSTDNESGRSNWNARVEAAQTHIYEPAILRLAQLMRIAGEVSLPQDATVAVKWRPLSDTDPKVEAETEKLQAEADQIYWTMQALDEMEIRQSRFGGTTGSIRLMDQQQRAQAAAETGDIGGTAPAPAPRGWGRGHRAGLAWGEGGRRAAPLLYEGGAASPIADGALHEGGGPNHQDYQLQR
jgi:hypothetical protein